MAITQSTRPLNEVSLSDRNMLQGEGRADFQAIRLESCAPHKRYCALADTVRVNAHPTVIVPAAPRWRPGFRSINLSQVVCGQLNRSGTEVLLESMTLRSALAPPSAVPRTSSATRRM
jgi:hypothetical protein